MPLCNEEEDIVHIPLKCPETKMPREHLLGRKGLIITQVVVYK
jgi:hypothetical protein